MRDRTRHDLKAVSDILQDSPQFLWITRNAPIWGREAGLKRFEENYQGTWMLEPQLDQIKVTELSPGVAQLFVPAVFTIGPAGQASGAATALSADPSLCEDNERLEAVHHPARPGTCAA
jgi:hypothetical protein